MNEPQPGALAFGEQRHVVIGNAKDLTQHARDFKFILGMRHDPNQRGQPGAGRAVPLYLIARMKLRRKLGLAEFALEFNKPIPARAKDGDVSPALDAETAAAEPRDFSGKKFRLDFGAVIHFDFFAGAIFRRAGTTTPDNLSGTGIVARDKLNE